MIVIASKAFIIGNIFGSKSFMIMWMRWRNRYNNIDRKLRILFSLLHFQIQTIESTNSTNVSHFATIVSLAFRWNMRSAFSLCLLFFWCTLARTSFIHASKWNCKMSSKSCCFAFQISLQINWRIEALS